MVFVSKLVGATALLLHLPLAQVAPTVPEVPTPGVETAPETDAPSERDRALLLLSGYHGIPTAAEFEAAFDDPAAVLFELATDPEVSAIHRDRAIGALAYWPSDALEAFYVDLLLDDATPEMERHRVIGHLAVAFGDGALEIIDPYLRDDDVQLRLTAVHAMAVVGTPAALRRLDAAAAVEASPIVLEQIRQVQGR